MVKPGGETRWLNPGFSTPQTVYLNTKDTATHSIMAVAKRKQHVAFGNASKTVLRDIAGTALQLSAMNALQGGSMIIKGLNWVLRRRHIVSTCLNKLLVTLDILQQSEG